MDVKIVGMVDGQILYIDGKKYYEDGNYTISVTPNRKFGIICVDSSSPPTESYTMEIDGTADFVVDASEVILGPVYYFTPKSSGRIQITMM